MLNADVPLFECLLRAEFLYDRREHFDSFVPVAVFGAASIMGRAIGFHVMTNRGAQIARVPINFLVHREDAPYINEPGLLQLWDCFSYEPAVHCFDFLSGMRCSVLLRDQKTYQGEYMFTIDWFGNNNSENAGDLGHKNAHIIKLDNGCYAAQPNNRIFWREAAFITNPFEEDEKPDYKTHTSVYKCENGHKWMTSDDTKMFYSVKNAEGYVGITDFTGTTKR